MEMSKDWKKMRWENFVGCVTLMSMNDEMKPKLKIRGIHIHSVQDRILYWYGNEMHVEVDIWINKN